MAKLRLLILSVGTQVGQNVLTTLAGRRRSLEVIATSSVAREPAIFDADAVYLVPPTNSEPGAFERRLIDIIARESIDLVVPCRDDDVAFLASLHDRRRDLAPRLLCGSAAMARVIADKWLSAEFCAENGLPFAPSLAEGGADERAGFARRHGYPLVAKPRHGYASQDVYLISNDAQFERILAREGWIVQKYLGDPRRVAEYLAGLETLGVPLYHTFQGLKHSIQVLIAPDGSIAQVICTRNAMVMRRSKWVEADRDPVSFEIGAQCGRVFAAAGWRGPLNVQCQRSADGALFIHEFNGRFTGATVDRWLLGFDEVGPAIECFTGVRIDGERASAPVALEVFESLVARGADPRDVEALTRDGVWRRAK
ncbi:MAG: hypothetical protein ACM338_04290 [Betaproteobacteria bacterium]